MANQRHVDMLKRDGVRVWNLWRIDEPDSRPDLRGTDLHRADLRGVDLSRVDLTQASLEGADLRDADLREANVAMANFTRANLAGADLSKAEAGGNLTVADLQYARIRTLSEMLDQYRLRRHYLLEEIYDILVDQISDLATFDTPGFLGANLHKAKMSEVKFRGVNLRGASLEGATLLSADLSRADLSDCNLRRAKLRLANLTGANLQAANVSEADLSGADLRHARFIDTNLEQANLSQCAVYGISAWNVRLGGAIQADLVITPPQETSISVDNLEVAQFLYLLLHNQKVRAVLDTITSKVVLILGRFSTERKPALDALRRALRNHPNGYIPVVFDFDPQHDKPVLETVKTLANLARFVIADLTDPNMVRSELTYITANVPTVPVQPVIVRDAHLPTEYGSWKEYKSFLDVYRYTDLSHLLASLTEAVIAPVEQHVYARRLADADTL